MAMQRGGEYAPSHAREIVLTSVLCAGGACVTAHSSHPPSKISGSATANSLHRLIGLGEGKMAVHWHHIVGEVHVAGVSCQNRLVQSCGGDISPC